MLFTEAIEKFINNLEITNKSNQTIIGYRKELKYFVGFWEEKYNYPPEIEDISEEQIEEYLKYKRDKGMATTTVARALHILSSFYKFLCKRKMCSVNPTNFVDSIRVTRNRREFLTKEEFETLIENTENELMKYIFVTLFNSGLRVSELTNLKIEDVNLDNRLIYVIGKGNKYREIPINNNLYVIFKEYLNTKESKSNYFFATKKTGRVSSQYINLCLSESLEKSGINKKISCHCLRHSFATNLLSSGANIQDVRDLLGHADIKTTSIYLHSISENLRNAVNLLQMEVKEV